MGVPLLPPPPPPRPGLTGRRPLGCPFRQSAGLWVASQVAAAEAGAGAALPGLGGGGAPAPPRNPAGPGPLPAPVCPAARSAALPARVCALHKTPLQRAGGARGETGAKARSRGSVGARFWAGAGGGGGEGVGTTSCPPPDLWICLNAVSFVRLVLLTLVRMS